MIRSSRFFAGLALPALALASCAQAEPGESGADGSAPFVVTQAGSFDEPWAIEFAPGTPVLFVTQKAGTIRFLDTESGVIGTVSGTPQVDYGGQGGLGDIAFLPSEASDVLDRRTIYLSWAEAGEGDTRGAAVGKGTLVCGEAESCTIEGLTVIWRQTPKVTGRGHYSHRISISSDGQYLFIASGDRQKMQPAQDTSNTLGTIVRLNLDGTPAPGNPLADQGGASAEIWSWGHRNILGMDWDASGRLWEVEHGPRGGDELNRVERGANYGWPERSNGIHYNGDPIADHSADDGFAKPALSWTPVIAPGDMIIYSGSMFADWQGDALIPGLSSQALVRVDLEGETAREVARYPFEARLRSIEQGPDGAIWIAEDSRGGRGGRVLKLTAE